MPTLQLAQCEAVVITFADTDGEITVAYASHATRSLIGCSSERAMQTPSGISVHADLRDDVGREGIIYHEPMGEPSLGEVDSPVKPPPDPDPTAFNRAIARQVASDISLMISKGLDDYTSPDRLNQARDQLVAAADLVDSLLKGIEVTKPLSDLAWQGVRIALTNGKL